MKTTTTATETEKLTPVAFLNSLQEVMQALATIRSTPKKRTEGEEIPQHLARLTQWLVEFPAEECLAQNRLPLNDYSNLETWKAYEWLTGDDYQNRYWRVKAEEILERLEEDGIDDRSREDMAEYELADLMREPQAQLSNAAANSANATTEDQSNLAQIIHLQLDALEQQKIAWQGQLLPNLPFHWTITQQDQQKQTTSDEAEPSWQSVVRFELPNLGVVAATINFHAGQLQLFLSTDTEETASKLKEHSFELSQALEYAGAPIKSLLVKRDEQA